MGENITIYFREEVVQLIKDREGRGALINDLIIDHFANDEDIIRIKLDKAEMEFNQLKARLNKKIEEKEMIRQKAMEVKKDSQEEINRKKQIESLKEKWQNNEIDDDEYFSHFDKGVFIA
jgi:flagellar biosynthesis GTPase FlhF